MVVLKSILKSVNKTLKKGFKNKLILEKGLAEIYQQEN
jgi:hypothetical protein